MTQENEKYLVIYDFEGRRGLSGNTYYAFQRLLAHFSIAFIQKSVYLVNSLDIARKLAEFLKDHGANVRIFKVVEV